MPIYMKYEGIKGNVTAKGHEGWIELTSARFDTARTSRPTGSGSGSTPVTSPTDISVGKALDEISTSLFQEFIAQKPKKVTIDFVELNDGKPRVYMSLELEGVIISSTQMNSSGGKYNGPSDYFLLNFSKITFSAKPAEVPKQTANKTNKSFWDLMLAKQP